MFPACRKARMDMVALGGQMAARKAKLMAEVMAEQAWGAAAAPCRSAAPTESIGPACCTRPDRYAPPAGLNHLQSRSESPGMARSTVLPTRSPASRAA